MTAQRALSLKVESTALEAQLAQLVQQLAPTLLAEHGVGTITAAQILCAWSTLVASAVRPPLQRLPAWLPFLRRQVRSTATGSTAQATAS